MRIIDIKIDNWRNFNNVRIEAPEDATLICLVGENGTGKSNILELISAVAHRLGVSPGVEIPRGDPFGEPHSFSVSIRFNETIESLLDEQQAQQFIQNGITWGGVLTVTSVRDEQGHNSKQLLAQGGGDEGQRINLASRLIQKLNERKHTHYLSLDADRAYPPIQIRPQEYASALSEDWETPQKKKHRAFAPTRTMYEEWVKYFLAKETQDATKLQQAMRRAKREGQPQPEFVDGFDPYKQAVQEVLPHLNFVGVDTTHKTLVFDSSGLELKFTNLSGGEREISFIIGQIERFQLQQGILLIDKPELHLNPDLLRNWVAYLRDTVEDGQVWISTHSLEAVETAGPSSTFVLERTQDTRIVENIRPLIDSPVLTVLSAAVGSPAFSLSNLKFVFIEGDRQGREKERFYSLYGDSRFVRFIEGGGCEEVMKKLSAVRELAAEADEQLFVGGIIDADFRTQEIIDELQSRTPVFVLSCHEIENIYLHPEALEVVRNRAGIQEEVQEITKRVADRFAGTWVLQRTILLTQLEIESKRALNQPAAQDWNTIDGDVDQFLDNLCAASGLQDDDLNTFRQDVTSSVEVYRAVRETNELWKKCLGKQTLGVIFQDFGISSVESLQNNIARIWGNGEANLPDELVALRDYINSIE
ncbi:MAG: AAA family ATPase [Candidatus Thiodiazotropha endolucinida]